MEDNDSGKQSHFFSHVERYFRKGDLLVGKMTPLKKYIYLPFTHLAFSQFYRAMEVDC